MRLTDIIVDGRWAEERDSDYKLTPMEQYLFSNCSRHGDTLGVIIGTPLACLAKVLLQKRFPAVNPIKVFILAGSPVLVATWACVQSVYMSRVCWGYLDLLPEDSHFKHLLLEEEKRGGWESFTTFNRIRAVTTVMSRDAHVDKTFDLSSVEFVSQSEKHEIQRQLRWVPPQEYRLMDKLREAFHNNDAMRGFSERFKNNEGMKSLFSPSMEVSDKNVRSACKALPKTVPPEE